MSTCHLLDGRYEVDVSEAMAARQAMRIAKSGFENLVLKSDCIKLIHHLRKGFVENYSFGNILLRTL